MKIKYNNTSSSHYSFRMELEKGETTETIGQGGKKINLLENTFSLNLPFEIKKPHSDLVALTLLTVVIPWVDKSIEFPEKVSKEFAEAVKKTFNKDVVGINDKLKPRVKGKTDGLSFSGGVDSMATSLVLPKDSVNISFLRKDHPRVENSHKVYSIKPLEKILKKVKNSYGVYSDLEHIVGPFAQYPTWTALSAPCILLADHFDLKTISYGTIVGSGWVIEGKKFKTMNEDMLIWQHIFPVVGIELTKPVAGLTEIGTSIIVNQSEYKDIANSCQYGDFQEPCMKCLKCFRKYLIDIGTNNKRPSEEILNNFLKQTGVQNYIQGVPPIYFGHNIMYAFSKIERSDLDYPLRMFYDKLMMVNKDISWCSKNYHKSTELFVKDIELRKEVNEKIKKYIPDMTEEEVKTIESWDLPKTYKDNQDKAEDYNKSIENYFKLQEEDKKIETINTISTKRLFTTILRRIPIKLKRIFK